MKTRIKIFWVFIAALSILLWSFTDYTETSNQLQTKENVYEKALQNFELPSKMDDYNVPGISFAVIKNGKLVWAQGYGVIQKGKPERINPETMFSVGSVSKVGAATISLKLQEQDKLDIDKNVNEYLGSWKVPDNQYTKNNAVTLRKIMSHTAGLNVHGFVDFLPNEKLPTTVQILKGEWPAKNSSVYVNIPIGSRFRYSGGGTTVEQLVIEELTKQEFHIAAKELLFQPLNMNRSSYQNPLPIAFGNIAKAHNRDGKPTALPRGYQSMPEAAASGLWTTPNDFSKLMIQLMKAHQGEITSYLSKKTVTDMMKPVAPSDYGLGPRINIEGKSIEFSHGGANDSYRAHFSGFLPSQNGFIIFTNGARGSGLINELRPVFNELLN